VANILYPTRGGDNTYRNQDRVIDLVREQKAKLLLLYVSSVRFLDRFASPVPVDLVKSQLDEMGEFLLAMAQERAEKQSVKAETMVKRGAFLEVLREVIEEHEINVVILGRPTTETALTTTEYISEVAQFLAAKRGVEVLVVDEGEIVERYQPGQGPEESS
jgi:nucleotide-binding universal stress UspA family protein